MSPSKAKPKKPTSDKTKKKAPSPKKPQASAKKNKRKSLGRKIVETLPVPGVMGRPLTLTKEKIEAICQHIQVGNYAVTACALEDIPERTYYNWVDRAQCDEQAGKDSIYTNFWQSIKKASAIAEDAQVKVALLGGFGWQANFTWLERKYPDRWGHQTKLSLEEARSFVHRLVSVLAAHIPDRELIRKIVEEVKSVKMEKHERRLS